MIYSDYANYCPKLSNLISKAISIDAEGNTTKYVEIGKLLQLTDIISGEGNRIIFMRHGEQSPPEWISSMPDPAIRKIRMMQNPFNREDSGLYLPLSPRLLTGPLLTEML